SISNMDNPIQSDRHIKKIGNEYEKGKRFYFGDSQQLTVSEDQSSATDSFDGVILSGKGKESTATFVFTNSTQFTLANQQSLIIDPNTSTRLPPNAAGNYEASVGAGFTSPTNLSTADGVYATAAPGKNAKIATNAKNFGFDSAIPSGAAIGTGANSVVIEYKFKVSTTSSVATSLMQWMESPFPSTNGTAHSDATEPTTDKIVTTDVTSERSWTPTDLYNANFKVHLEAQRGNSNTAVTFSYDYVKVTVVWTDTIPGSTNPSESPSFADTMTTSKAAMQSLSESLSFADTMTKTLGKSLSESPSFTDTMTTAKAKSQSLSESPSFADTMTKTTGKSLSESPSFTDTMTTSTVTQKSFSESPSFADTMTKTTGKSLSESPSFTDTMTTAKAKSQSLSESPSFADTMTKTTGKSLSESPSFTDTMTTSTVTQKSFSESPSFADTMTKTTGKSLSESPSFTDTMTTAKAKSQSLS